MSGRAAISRPNVNVDGLTRLYRIPDFIILDIEAVALMLISNSVRQARTKRDADIEALRAATTKAELALVQAENDLLRQRVRALEAALARRESAAKSAQTKAIRVIARLKEKNNQRRSQTSSNVRLVQPRDHKCGRPDLQGKWSDSEGAAS